MDKKKPTREEIKAARAQIRAGRKVLIAARAKHGRRRLLHRAPSRDFFVWIHDFHTLIRSAAHSSDLPPGEMIDRAAAAADRMAEIIGRRKPDIEERPSRAARVVR